MHVLNFDIFFEIWNMLTFNITYKSTSGNAKGFITKHIILLEESLCIQIDT